MGEDREWSWAGEDGAVHELGEDELTFALSSEELPAYTLVCHSSWAEWLPAMQVAELVWALPSGQADAARKAAVRSEAAPQPRPPLEGYPALKQRFLDIVAGKIDPRSESQISPKPAEVTHRVRDVELDLGSIVDSEFDAVLDTLHAAFESSAPPRSTREDDAADETHAPEPDAGSTLEGEANQAPPRKSNPKPALPLPRGRFPSVADGKPSSVPRPKQPSSSGPSMPPPTRAELQSSNELEPLGARRNPLDSITRSKQPSSPGVPPPPVRSQLPSSPGIPPPSSRPKQASSPLLAPPRSQLPSVTELAPPRSPPPSAPVLGNLVDPQVLADTAHIIGEETEFPSRVPPDVAPNSATEGASTVSVEPPRSAPSSPAALADPEFKSGPRPIHFLLGVLAVGLIGAGVWFAGTQSEDDSVVAVPTAAPAPPPEAPKTTVTTCPLSGAPTRLFEFAKPEVKPIFGDAVGGSKVSLGFAQTSRLAIGMTINAQELAGTIEAREDDPSPMLSVVPKTGGDAPEYLVERAASTLQTARAIPAQTPLSIGLRQKHIAVRRDKKDVDLWESPWEMLSVPEVVRIDEKVYVVAFRGGGRRGSVLFGKVSEEGQALGKLQTLEVDAARIGEPSLGISEGRVVVVLDGGADISMGEVFIGLGKGSEVPVSAQRLESIKEASAPGVVGLPGGGVFVHWTEGPIGKQRVYGRAFDKDLQARGQAYELSPAGTDAHHSVAALVGDRMLTVYFVRVGNNHEMWIAALDCKTTEE